MGFWCLALALGNSYEFSRAPENVAAWEEGEKTVQKAKLFSAGAFVLLLLLGAYSFIIGDAFGGVYFWAFSAISLILYFYVRRIFKGPQG